MLHFSAWHFFGGPPLNKRLTTPRKLGEIRRVPPVSAHKSGPSLGGAPISAHKLGPRLGNIVAGEGIRALRCLRSPATTTSTPFIKDNDLPQSSPRTGCSCFT